MILRKEIAEIVDDAANRCREKPCDDYPNDCRKCLKPFVDRICSAIGKAAEGMPKGHAEDDGSDWQIGVRHGIQCQYNECQAYWQKELGK